MPANESGEIRPTVLNKDTKTGDNYLLDHQHDEMVMPWGLGCQGKRA